MPIKVQNNLPAKKIMEQENIFMMDETRAVSQDIRPLYIAVLNLMPLKEETEVQLLRSLSNTPLQVEITFLTTASYIGTNTKASHLNEFYLTCTSGTIGIRRSTVLGGIKTNYGVVEYPCDVYHAYLLGGSGGIILPLWHT